MYHESEARLGSSSGEHPQTIWVDPCWCRTRRCRRVSLLPFRGLCERKLRHYLKPGQQHAVWRGDGRIAFEHFQDQELKSRLNTKKMENLIKEKKGTVVDVRTPGEFMGGHVAGSINIPLQELMQRMDELKQIKQPLILCCASGNRSGQAQGYLSSQGIECYNGGSWLNVNRLSA